MAQGTIVIDEKLCKGCGLCIEFCNRDCLAPGEGNISAEGYILPSLARLEQCTGCGICGWMCPDLAITVYRWPDKRP